MKRERRQELRTNELAQSLLEMRDFFRKNGTFVVGGVVLFAAVLLVINYTSAQRASTRQSQWSQLMEIRGKLGADAPDNLKTLESLRSFAVDATDPELAKQALVTCGRTAEGLALNKPAGADATLLEKARDAYTELLSRFGGDSMLDAGAALSGLASIEASYFALDADPSRKDKARQYWQRLLDEPRFKGTPFESQARLKLNTLDTLFRPVTMIDVPPATQPTTTLPATAPAPVVTLPDEGSAPAPPLDPPPAPPPDAPNP